MKKYQIIYADPPWKGHYFRRNSTAYPLMSVEKIASLPIQSIVHQDALLFMWVTMSAIPDALRVIDGWGFQFVTNGFTWIKTCSKSNKPAVGLGMWTRHNAEICLLAKRGRPTRQSFAVRSLVTSPRLRHSQKPAVVRDRIVELCGDIPRLELFARTKTPGWDIWGNELSNDLELSIAGSPCSENEKESDVMSG